MRSAKLPEQAADLFTGKAVAHLATVSAGGGVQITPVWIDREGDLVLVNTAKGRVKDRNMRNDARVAIEISDPANPYRYLSIQGRVVEIRSAGADAQLDRLAKRYLGKDKYPWRRPGDVRQIFVIQPERVYGL